MSLASSCKTSVRVLPGRKPSHKKRCLQSGEDNVGYRDNVACEEA